jgi:hypothetical protein
MNEKVKKEKPFDEQVNANLNNYNAIIDTHHRSLE